MRVLGIVCAVTLFALPCRADEMSTIRFLAANTSTLGGCSAIGFGVDSVGLSAKMDALRANLVNAGAEDSTVARNMEEAYAAGRENSPSLSGDDPAGISPSEALANMEHRFSRLQTRCEELLSDSDIGPYITAEGYQASGGLKSFFGMTAYQANHGDAGKMLAMGTLYEGGARPDPGHKLEFYWYSKAAEHGSAVAADMLAAEYFTGRGVKTDFAEAEKWAIIAESLGVNSDTRKTIESAISRPQQMEGRRRAVNWLKLTAH